MEVIKPEELDSETSMDVEEEGPLFTPITNQDSSGIPQSASLRVPNHRLNALQQSWMEIYNPIVNHLKLQIRFNTRTRHIELRSSELTTDIGSVQKAVDFVKAFILGFQLQDALALLRLDDIFVETFSIEDVKSSLHGDHLSRAIGRICGKDGKTKFTIENATRTRLVISGKMISVMGSYKNIQIARNAVCDLILGSPPGKIYAKLSSTSSRVNERF
eukprot:TRINITY_DN7873_c0_g1_i1.p1 TRINITY_DN7873_c0_g1~~TRINITY_DN7873_c0_g1_i1.p1  ORF type:complete len:217 (+),score=27.67 TRINITY_DN7873_c0_g1_i1:73-723(+)